MTNLATLILNIGFGRQSKDGEIPVLVIASYQSPEISTQTTGIKSEEEHKVLTGTVYYNFKYSPNNDQISDISFTGGGLDAQK